jgi:hypothetical protein
MQEEDVADDVPLTLPSSRRPEARRIAWCNRGVIAVLMHGQLIKLWDVAQYRSFVLSIADATGDDQAAAADPILCIAFHPRTHALAGATRSGKVHTWVWSAATAADGGPPE